MAPILVCLIFRVQALASGVSGLSISTKNFAEVKQSPFESSKIITALPIGEQVNIMYIEGDWAYIIRGGDAGYVRLDTFYEAPPVEENKIGIDTALYIEDKITESPAIENGANNTGVQIATVVKERASKVTFPTWDIIKADIFKLNTPAEVYDIKSGKVYYVQSFSNGNHADVETVTQQDTDIMFDTFGGEWSWDVRPVWVTINGATIAGSINGMPHASETIYDNGMNGQICIHFKGSKTHNGNQSYTDLHQEIAQEAYDISQN
jgi:hypothetical protein